MVEEIFALRTPQARVGHPESINSACVPLPGNSAVQGETPQRLRHFFLGRQEGDDQGRDVLMDRFTLARTLRARNDQSGATGPSGLLILEEFLIPVSGVWTVDVSVWARNIIRSLRESWLLAASGL
jgi:hypothetical protein